MINSRSHTHLPPPDTSAKMNHCPLILSYCPLVYKSTTKSSIQVVAWEVTNSITSAWPAKYLFTNSFFKTDQGVTRSRHGSFAFQIQSKLPPRWVDTPMCQTSPACSLHWKYKCCLEAGEGSDSLSLPGVLCCGPSTFKWRVLYCEHVTQA